MSVIHWNEQIEVVKDPADQVVKHFSYERLLVGNAILASSTWDVTSDEEEEPELEVDQDSITNDGVYATFRLIGGTGGVRYTVANTAVSNESPAQTFRRSIDVVVREL